MKRVKRGEKGVSPIVATAILVLISVVAGVLLWLWISGFTSAATAGQPALAERIKIEAANGTDTSVIALVRNVGGVRVNITHVYVFNATGALIVRGTLEPPVSISPGEVGRVSISWTGAPSLAPGASYTIKVVTRNGVEATYTFVRL